MKNYEISCYDGDYAGRSVLDVIDELREIILNLEARVEELERENVATTNEIYRLENSLDARIDILMEK